MNVMEMLPLITKLMSDPKSAIKDGEKWILPLWLKLEKQAGGELSLMLTRSDDATAITVSLWTSPEPGQFNKWKVFSLPELVDEFQNIKNFIPNEYPGTNIIAEADSTPDTADGTDTATGTAAESGNDIESGNDTDD